MSTQKRKFELFQRLAALGFSYEEAHALRRIEMTLQRWGERECGDGSNWGLERDDTTGKPFNVYHGPGESRRYPVADRELGAKRRLAAIMAGHRSLVAYHQGDCRGCNLYVLRKSDMKPGEDIGSVYTRGLAVRD